MTNKLPRATKQRYAIKRSIEESGRPLGPKEILKKAGALVPNLGIATVYRNIKSMLDKGDLETVEIPGQAPRYQTPGQPFRPHFVCTRCDRVFNLNGKTVSSKTTPPSGFHIEREEIILYGLRPECQERARCPFS